MPVFCKNANEESFAIGIRVKICIIIRASTKPAAAPIIDKNEASAINRALILPRPTPQERIVPISPFRSCTIILKVFEIPIIVISKGRLKRRSL